MGQYQLHDTAAPVIRAHAAKGAHAVAESPPARLLAEVLKEADKKHYDRAISLSRKHGCQDPDIINARGVCLMRTDKYDEAIVLFRGLVLEPGCTWMRRDRPVHYKTNFATALLLGGHPNGCLEVLCDLAGDASPSANVLRSAIKRWESSLPFWAWLDWKINRTEPKNRPVQIDFEPGDFGTQAAPTSRSTLEEPTTPPCNAA
jgi:hypothetical protein